VHNVHIAAHYEIRTFAIKKQTLASFNIYITHLLANVLFITHKSAHLFIS